MSNDRDALVAAIRECPDDDTPRLVLADWYEENGQAERGEFIRVQCELANTDSSDPRYPELHVRQLEMLAAHEKEWLGEWADNLVRWEFRRGMLDEVTITPEPYCQAGAELFREHPVSRVAFVDDEGESLAPPAIRDVLSQPHSRHLRAIDAAGCKPGEQAAAMFGGRIHTNAWLTEIASRAALDGLRELSLFGGTRNGRDDIDLTAWQAFCAAEHLGRLTHLDLSNLSDNNWRSGAWISIFRELAGAGFAPKLRSLKLDGCAINDEALSPITRSGRFTCLQLLHFGGWHTLPMTASSLEAFLDPKSLPALHEVTLPFGASLAEVAGHPGWCRFAALTFFSAGDHRDRDASRFRRAWQAIVRSPHLQPTVFRFAHNSFNPAEAGFWDELAGARWFANLRELSISTVDYDCTPLFDRPLERFPRLRSLSLSPSTELVERLAAWPGLANLVELSLNDSYHSTDPEASVQLFKSPYLTPRLSRLCVSGICRSPEAVAAMANCPALVGLEHLDFAFNELSPESAALASSPHLRHLKHLHTWSEWDESDRPNWLRLADPQKLPQLRDVVIGSGTHTPMQEKLRRRFGPRLRIFADC